MPLPSAEMIERAARAIVPQIAGEVTGPDDAMMVFFGPLAEKCALAALTAIIPEVVEKCARAASEACWKHEGDDQYSRGMDAGARHQTSACVTAIRSLIPKEKNNNG
jgi:hypothetical protein